MRKFDYLTVGVILNELAEEGCKITRITFYRLENEGLFLSARAAGGWRVYTRGEVDIIKHLIKENYRK